MTGHDNRDAIARGMDDWVVIGLGQPLGGDDSVGLQVARRLAGEGVEARQCTDASALLPLLEAGRSVILVDGVVCEQAPGSVFVLQPAELGQRATALSSHGLGVAEVLALAQTLYGAAMQRVRIVGIAIEPPGRAAESLSPAVLRALAPACDVVRALLAEERN